MVRVDVVTGQPPPAPQHAHHDLYCSPYGEFYPPDQHYYLSGPGPNECPPQMQQICTVHGEYGPMTVPMVSTNSSPPMPVPVQVPPGHVLQQIVDESGTLRHVILSPQPPGAPHMPPPHMQHGPPPQHYGPANGGSGPQQFYGPPGYPPPHFHPHGPPLPPPQPPPHQPHHLPHSPPHPYHKDERAQRQYIKLRRKLEHKHIRNDGLGFNSGHSTPALSPRKEFTNGTASRAASSGMGGTSSEGEGSSSAATSVQGDEEESQPLLEFLSSLQRPQVSDVTARSALVQWSAPTNDGSPSPPYAGELTYELLLGDRDRYKAIYSGPSLSCRVEDLRPGTEYNVCLQAHAEGLTGSPTDTAVVRTPACEPAAPLPPRVTSRARTALQLRWNPPHDNGSHVQQYILQYDEGKGGEFVDLCRTRTKQHHLQKLEGSTRYRFRLAAVNEAGKGPWSEEAVFSTSGTPPDPPEPPILMGTSPRSLALRWNRRPGDEEFSLQREDESTRHGYLAAYTGRDLEHLCEGLTRCSDYKFRLAAHNTEGASRWSEEVTYRTAPEAPSPPSRPATKGKVHANSFRVKWDPPLDGGGAEIQRYTLEIDSGSECRIAYAGPEQEATCDRLRPGRPYRVRVSCSTAGGSSGWSEYHSVATEPVVPGPCAAPTLRADPRPDSVSLAWRRPDYDGGSPVLEYHLSISEDGGEDDCRPAYRGKETECTVQALLPGRRYFFAVRSFNRAGAGPRSETLAITSGAAPPDPPAMLRAVARSPFTVALQWEEPASNGGPLADYRVEMNSEEGESREFAPVYRGRQPTCEVKNLTPFTAHLFRVCASNCAGASEWSEVASASTPAAAPGAPPDVSAEVTATDALVAWREPPSNGSAVLHYRLDLGERVVVTDGPALECRLTGLIPETTYRVRVQAVNEVGVGGFSPTLKVGTLPPPPSPPPLSCSQRGHNFLKLKWGEGKNSDFTQYTVEMLVPRRKEFQTVYEGTSLTCRVKRLQESAVYRFRICAADDAGGQGDFSDEFEFETTPAPPPPMKAPRLALPEVEDCALLEWSPPKAAGDELPIFVVQYCRAKDQDYKQVYRGPETTVRMEELESGCEYWVRVCGERQVGGGTLQGAWSPPLSFSTPAAALVASPSAPSTPHARRAARRPPPSTCLSDRHYTFMLLFGFVATAVFAAVAVERFIDWRKSV